MLIDNLRDVASHSSLHGVKFLADSRRWYQRLYWILALSVCTIISYDQVRDDWLSWKAAPVDIHVNHQPSSTSSISIPAVTVCDDAYLDKPSVTEYLKSGNETLIHEVLYLCKLLMGRNNYCDSMYSDIYNVTLSDVEFNNRTFLRTGKERTFEMFKNLISPSDRIILKNDDSPIECGYFAFTTLGRNSFCHTLGLLPLYYVYREDNLAKFLTESFTQIDKETYFRIELDPFNALPTLSIDEQSCHKFSNYPSTFAEIYNGFKLKFVYESGSILQEKGWEKIDSDCKFTVHSPWEVPSPFLDWQPCEHLSTSDTLISFKIEYTYTDSDVETAALDERECVFPHEKPLRYFSYYSHKNCLFECVANISAEECGCVSPDMPNTSVVDFCEETESKHCVEEILNAYTKDQDASNDLCGCFPLCNNIDYIITDQDLKLSCEKHNRRTVHELKLAEPNYYSRHRHLTDDSATFLITTMTTLDMFLGFSVVSILELIYFLMVIAMRWIEQQRLDHREKKRLRKESTLSNNNWCIMCKNLKTHEHAIQNGNKTSENNTSPTKASDHQNFSVFLHDSNFLESHGFDENCSNCRKFHSSASNAQIILWMKKEIRKEMGEQLAGFVDHRSLSEIKKFVDEMRSEIHELKRKQDIWE